VSKQPPPGQEQTQYKTKEQPDERPAERKSNPPEAYVSEPTTFTLDDTQTNAKQKPAVKMEEQKVTAGRNGERNIRIEWINVPVGIHISARFNITTQPGNELEVTMLQLEYRKVFNGQGTVSTTMVPVAPIGTPGKMIVRDVTSGEIVEQPWKWRSLGRNLSLWGWIKELLGF
jgi:hypothetical protein